MRYGYTLTAVRNRLSGEKAAYAAHVCHKDILRGEALYKAIAEYLAINESRAKNLVTGLGGFVQEKLKAGYRLDFGLFKAGLTLQGGFDSVNAPFDATRNKVGVALTPGAELKKAVADMQLENLTDVAAPVLESVWPLDDPARRSVIVCKELCGLNGSFPATAFTGEGDGVWLETKTGQRVAEATIRTQDATRIDCVFQKAVARGRYQLVIGFHVDDTSAIATSSLAVSVVPPSAA